ncbi:hypothetical protein Tco_1090137 [Tanacetum coccineum]|uniref:Uncharacterized protein n=1 Tax=Tanacetum coccineum TaxID=301880 RepID=A0ABQ5I4L8_9ASTR
MALSLIPVLKPISKLRIVWHTNELKELNEGSTRDVENGFNLTPCFAWGAPWHHYGSPHQRLKLITSNGYGDGKKWLEHLKIITLTPVPSGARLMWGCRPLVRKSGMIAMFDSIILHDRAFENVERQRSKVTSRFGKDYRKLGELVLNSVQRFILKPMVQEKLKEARSATEELAEKPRRQSVSKIADILPQLSSRSLKCRSCISFEGGKGYHYHPLHVLEIWCLRSGNGGVSVVVRGGSGGEKGCLDHWIQRSSPLLPPLQRL